MRLYYSLRGGHVHCRVFTTGKCGDLVFRVEEWATVHPRLMQAFLCAEETGPELGTTVTCRAPECAEPATTATRDGIALCGECAEEFGGVDSGRA